VPVGSELNEGLGTLEIFDVYIDEFSKIFPNRGITAKRITEDVECMLFREAGHEGNPALGIKVRIGEREH